MARSKIGFHAAEPGNLAGWGDYINQLDAAGIPAVCMSVGGGGVGDIVARWDSGSQVGHVIGVRYMPPGGGQDVPPYGAEVLQAAADWWAWLNPLIGQEVRRHREKVWIVTGNELDKNQADWLGRFYVALANIMRAEGFKLCGLNFSTGEPETEHWETPGMLAYLRLCAQFPDFTAVGLHEYSLANDLITNQPWLIGRFQQLHGVCDARQIRRPTILITEFGWQSTAVPAPAAALAQLPQVAALYAANPNILGAGIWTLGNWGGCIPNCVQALIGPVRDYTQTAVFPDPPPLPPGGGDFKSVVFKIGQEHTLAEWQQIAALANAEYKRTQTASHNDLITMVAAGNSESYGVIFDPDLPSQMATIAAMEAAGLAYRLRYLRSFHFTHWPTNERRITQRFRANPENYIQFGFPGHEGADIAAATGSPVFAAAAGTVAEVHPNPAGHNYGIHIKINHSGAWQTTYAHLQAITAGIVPGTAVAGGQQIGRANNTGNSFGSHLHLTLKRIGQTYVDQCGVTWPANIHNPEPYLQQFEGVTWPAPVGCPSPEYDLANYVIGASDGRAIEVRHPGGSTETFQYQQANGWAYLVKNSQWEQLRIDPEFIWRGKDTSPGPAPQNAERPGAARWYWQQEPGQNAARWCRRFMRVGETWAGPGHYVQFYYKSDCANSAINSGNATNAATLVAHHDQLTWNGITLADVLEFRGAGQEIFFFARDWGMVAWVAPWGQSAVSELFQPGQRNLTRETGCFS